MSDIMLICCIVGHDKGSKTLRIAKKHRIKGGTICIGKGTVKNKLLELLDLNDCRKEIVLMGAPAEDAYTATEQVAREMAFHKPGHGIAFIMPLSCILGSRGCHKPDHTIPVSKEDTHMHNAIVTIVEKGMAQEVIAAANAAGARGGTVIHARGSGIHETEVLFAMPIEPEKEVVLIIAEQDLTQPIAHSIREAMDLDSPGKGIMMISGIDQVYGLY